MSSETMEYLNAGNILVGFTAKRGTSWWHDPELDAENAESTQYEFAIPVGDVKRRLFGWSPVSRRMAMEIPADLDNFTHISDDGLPMRWAVQDDIQGIARDDTHARLGIFGAKSYKIHLYGQWLVDAVEKIIGQGLDLSSAGLLKGGAVAWAEISLPDNLKTRHGVEFRPNLLATTTCDGSLATTYKLTNQLTVCDNTREIALSEDSPTLKVRHSSNSLGKISDVREALALVVANGEAALKQFDREAETDVSKIQFKQVIDLLVPVPEGPKATKRGITIANTKRDQIAALYANDPRVAPWNGTEFGILQAFNTWNHHVQGGLKVGGGDGARADRNALRAITGETGKSDAQVSAAVRKVLANA